MIGETGNQGILKIFWGRGRGHSGPRSVLTASPWPPPPRALGRYFSLPLSVFITHLWEYRSAFTYTAFRSQPDTPI